MRPLTLIRAVAWLGVLIAGWSLNVKWGTEAAVGNGPPGHWERQVVGAVLLVAIGAVILMAMGRRGAAPGWLARGLATVLSLGGVLISVFLRQSANNSGFTDLIAGPGWTWLFAGCGLTVAACLGGLLLPKPKRKVKVGSKSARRRR